jgi:hypothetical protein
MGIMENPGASISISKKRHYSGSIGNSKVTRYKINDYLAGRPNWNAEELKKRQESMIDSLKNILKTPKN